MDTETTDFELSASAHLALSKQFKSVIHELSTNPNLDPFRVEYEKLYRGQEKSHTNEQRLMKKVCIAIHAS